MSDLSVAEKNIGSWLSSHASALTSVADLLKTVTGAIPTAATQTVSTAISGIEALAGQASAVASNVQNPTSVTTAAAVVTDPPTLAVIENTLEQDALAAAMSAAEAGFTDLMAGKPLATVEQDALNAGETAFVQRGTSN